MRKPTRRKPPGVGDRRPRAGDESTPRPSRGGGMAADDLLEIADELEEQGRALLARARQLQRMAARAQGGGAPRSSADRSPARDHEPGGEGTRRPAQTRQAAARGARGRKPEWAPEHKKKKS